MIAAGLTRTPVNQPVGRLVHAFERPSAQELVPLALHRGTGRSPGSRRGERRREPACVKPVPGAFLERQRPHVARQVWAMVGLQALTGMRPGGVTKPRTSDLDTAGRGGSRRIPFIPKVRASRPGPGKLTRHLREQPQLPLLVPRGGPGISGWKPGNTTSGRGWRRNRWSWPTGRYRDRPGQPRSDRPSSQKSSGRIMPGRSGTRAEPSKPGNPAARTRRRRRPSSVGASGAGHDRVD